MLKLSMMSEGLISKKKASLVLREMETINIINIYMFICYYYMLIITYIINNVY